MPANDLSGRLGLDSTDFKTQIATLNRELRVMESGFRASAAGLGDWENNANGVEMRIKSLNSQMDVQAEKVKRLRGEYERVAKEQGESSRGAQELLIKLNKENETLGKMETELKKTKTALEGLGKSSEKTGDQTEKLKKSEDRAKDSTHKFGTSLAGLSTHLKNLSGRIGGVLSKLGQLAGKLAIGVVGAATVATAAVGAFFASTINPASNLNETMSKIDQVFGGSADQVKAFGDKAAASLGMSANAALTAAGTYGNLFRSMGIGEGKSAELSTNLVTLAGDLASFNNMDPTEVLDKLRAGLTGEAEPLKALGVNINEAIIKEKALELGLYSGKGALDAAAKAQAAYALIIEQTSLAQGDFERTSGGLANQQRIAAANIENIKAKLGTGLLPIVTAITKGFNKLVESPFFTGFLDKIVAGMDRFAESLEGVFEKIGKGDFAGAFKELTSGIDIGAIFKSIFSGAADFDLGDTIGDLIVRLLQGAITKPAKLLKIGLKILNSLASSITSALPNLLPVFTNLLSSIVQFITQNLQILLAAGIQIILTLGDGLLGQLPTLISVALQLIVALANGISKAIPQLLPMALQLIVALVDGLIIALPILIAAIPQIMTSLVTAMQKAWPLIVKAGSDLLAKVVKGVTDAWPKIKESGKQIGTIWINGVKENIATFLSMGGQIVTAVWNGIKEKATWFYSQIKSFFSGLIKTAKDAIGWHSPPAAFVDIGKGMANALGLGWTKEFGGIERNIKEMMSGLASPTINPSIAMAGAGVGIGARGGAAPVKVEINATVGNNIDIRRLAREVAGEIQRNR